MSYEPTDWKNGDVIGATQLNNIERGISDMNSSYTPTEWTNGDVITAEKLNNIETGIVNSGGGGGDSDYSTAHVSLISNGNTQGVDIYIPYIYADALYTYNTLPTDSNTYDIDVVLYKGTAECALPNNAVAVQCAGNSECYFDDVNTTWITITGDCELTFAPRQ